MKKAVRKTVKPQSLGEVAWLAYYPELAPCPWGELPEATRRGWTAIAQAISTEVRRRINQERKVQQ